VPGRNYQVYATTNVAAAFQPLSGVFTAFTRSTSYTNPSPVRTREFYRVRTVP